MRAEHAPPRIVALISLEAWDDVWRRNQYLVTELFDQGFADEVRVVEPPGAVGSPERTRTVAPGVVVISPSLRLPKRVGGLVELGKRLRRQTTGDACLLWVNDPSLGVHCLRPGQRAVYDVTDDWRWVDGPYRIWKRVVRAEDVLARKATTVVCSEVLHERWSLRYSVDADVVHNGVDAAAWRSAGTVALPGDAPHVGYVGTLHDQRLDVPLLLEVADDADVGTLHLVGPNALSPGTTADLEAHPKMRLHPPVPPQDVPAWTSSFDVLVCPHLVSPFTLSLDAIKSYEYAASGRPVVATPSSGFQSLTHSRVTVVDRSAFVAAVAASTSSSGERDLDVPFTWSARARDFAAAAGLA